GVLTAGHARAVLAAGSAAAMLKLADKIVNEELSVRQAEAAAAQLAGTTTRAKTTKPSAGSRQGQLNEIAERLGDRLDTRVTINLGQKKGSIVIDFATVGDLNRILGELGVDGFR
ncbi:MAG: chromosome partitioning protein ParB, partial [Yonghaparkia sp.]|nr:chromosome partitioning protein ParB [Microcella sp.]